MTRIDTVDPRWIAARTEANDPGKPHPLLASIIGAPIGVTIATLLLSGYWCWAAGVLAAA